MIGLLAVYAYLGLAVGFTWLIRRRDEEEGPGSPPAVGQIDHPIERRSAP